MKKKEIPRLLIEDWLPAPAIGVECMRERATGQNPPNARLHVWWARRPLTASRAAVLASLLPASFPRDVFERLLGFWGSSAQIIKAQKLLDAVSERGNARVKNPHGERAFKNPVRSEDLKQAHEVMRELWEELPTVLDPMAGGGSIPLEASRLGLHSLANELNPVACSVLEATVDYPFRYGNKLAERSKFWAAEWRKRFNRRMEEYFPDVEWTDRRSGKTVEVSPHTYIFARTVPCPDTHFPTPLVPDWHLLKPKGSLLRVWAQPIVDKNKGTWSVEIVDSRKMRGKKSPPQGTISDGKGISLFTNHQIPSEYIKAQAQSGKMGSAVYAIAVKTPNGLEFIPPTEKDLKAICAAEKSLRKVRKQWEESNIIPTEEYPLVTSDPRPRLYGMPKWADMFSARQLLGFGVINEELRKMKRYIDEAEKNDPGLAEAVVHLLSIGMDKFLNWNSILSSWNAPYATARSVFDRHDFSFKSTFCEMAPCGSGVGFEWATSNAIEAFQDLANLCSKPGSQPSIVMQGSAAALPQIAAKTVNTVVVDPPYSDNVQYSELADFFYVWLKRTQGHRRPEWFSTYLCDSSEEAVVNVSRHKATDITPSDARRKAHEFYQKLMTDIFREARRVLKDEGALTVMFTHKKQEAWEALFTSLIHAGFTITATWPIKTEGEHSLHQAKKNAAQSTVILVARKRPESAEVGLFDQDMRSEIQQVARKASGRLQNEGLNPVDQLVGSFGPAMEVYSRYKEVKTDTGEKIGVEKAIDEASEAVAAYRIELLAKKGLQGVEGEARFYLLCWSVLQAAEFRFNEAMLLGKAVGMDVDSLITAGLVTKTGDKITIVPARDRRRSKKLDPDEVEQTLFGPTVKGKKKRARKADVLMIHPNDPRFRTTLDACHALALRYVEAGGERMGIGAAKQLATQQQWTGDSAVARLMEALVKAAPDGVRFPKKKGTAAVHYPEFSSWHSMLKPVFGIEPPEWKEGLPKLELEFTPDGESEEAEGEDEEQNEE